MFIRPKVTRMKRYVSSWWSYAQQITDKRLTSFLEKELQQIKQKNKGYDQKVCNMDPQLVYKKGKA